MKNMIYMECRGTEVKNGKTIEHNKFYQLNDNGDDTLTAWFGKIGTEGRKLRKPLSDWFELEQKRRNHGYKEVFKKAPADPKINAIRAAQLEKVNIIIKLLDGHLDTFEKRLARAIHDTEVKKIKSKLEKGDMLLTGEEMINLNMIYSQLS